MEVKVYDNLESALLQFRRSLDKDGIFRTIKLREEYPSKSERRKAKSHVAMIRRIKAEKRRQERIQAAIVRQGKRRNGKLS